MNKSSNKLVITTVAILYSLKQVTLLKTLNKNYFLKEIKNIDFLGSCLSNFLNYVVC